MYSGDALRRAKWRESVGLEVPGSTPVKYFDSFSEFLDDQVQQIVSDMPSEVRAGFEKLRDELEAETSERKDPDVILTAVDPYYRDDVYIGDLIHPSSEFDE